MYALIDNSVTYRSMFITWNNPEYDYIYKHDETGKIITDKDGNNIIIDKKPTCLCGKTYEEMCEYVVDTWCKSGEGYTAACVYCISGKGLHHLHIVFECPSSGNFRYSAVQKLFGQRFHIEVTRGSKKEVEDYIFKQGKFAESDEVVVCRYQHGDLKGSQGSRVDLIKLRELIFDKGMTPDEILGDVSMTNFFESRKYEALKNMYYYKKKSELPSKRDVTINWCFGKTGSGKTYQYDLDYEEYGKYNVWRAVDYSTGWFDNYQFQDIVYFDEFRGGLKYSELLDLTEGRNSDVHCRGTNNNKPAAFSKLYICSPYCPDGVYKNMVSDADRGIDAIDQLMRRITTISYFETDHPKYGPWRKFVFKGDGWDFFQRYKAASSMLKNYSMNDYFMDLIKAGDPAIEKISYPGKPRPTV